MNTTTTSTSTTSSTVTAEQLPVTWDDARDGAFFRITADVLTPSQAYGASVLLASYDED